MDKKKLIGHVFISSIVLFLAISTKAHAEYYLVYPGSAMYVGCANGCARTCYSPCLQTPVHYFYSDAPRRHAYSGSGEMAEYKWITAP